MSAFNDLNAAAQSFSETVMGETFSHTSAAGSTTSGLSGVFNQAQAVFSFEDFSQKQVIDLVCVSGKEQWGAVVPANRETITYGGVAYAIHSIDGLNSAGEPAFTLGLKKLA